MSRIPSHTVEDAPEASREALRNVIQFSPTGRPLNLHRRWCTPRRCWWRTPRCVRPPPSTARSGRRSAPHYADDRERHRQRLRRRITGRLAGIVGWTDEQVAALRAGISLGDNKIDALTGLVREAAVNAGSVTDTTWTTAQGAGWNDEELAEAFACLGLSLFTAYFLNYAQTESDV
jgi:hypothetical protein